MAFDTASGYREPAGSPLWRVR